MYLCTKQFFNYTLLRNTKLCAAVVQFTIEFWALVYIIYA